LFLPHTKSIDTGLLPDIVWQNWNYISNLLDLGENPTCCLAKREIYFQFPRAASGARNVVWQFRYYTLPNKLCKRAAGVDPLTKL
jgi:hypothetical protein